MNIFVLDSDPKLCAEYHCDKHVVKMVLETAQLLSNCVEHNNGITYRHTHMNHPASLWTRESSANFEWLYSLGIALSSEYTFRYGKIHKSLLVIEQCNKLATSIHFPKSSLQPFCQCMPEQYKIEGNAIQAYRDYYIGDKSDFAKWTIRSKPNWWIAK